MIFCKTTTALARRKPIGLQVIGERGGRDFKGVDMVST